MSSRCTGCGGEFPIQQAGPTTFTDMDTGERTEQPSSLCHFRELPRSIWHRLTFCAPAVVVCGHLIPSHPDDHA